MRKKNDSQRTQLNALKSAEIAADRVQSNATNKKFISLHHCSIL